LYILTNKRNGIMHVGIARDLKQILETKQSPQEGRFAQKYQCNQLVWYKQFPCTEDALDWEFMFKWWSRLQKMSLVERMNPYREDLSMKFA